MALAPTRAPLPLPRVIVFALRPFQAFFRTESSSGILLLLATAAALAWSNSEYRETYHRLLDQTVTVQLGRRGISWPLHHFINDALMAVFFFLVGMEIKRELVLGELRTLGSAALPLIAALGGMAFPALLFTALNIDGPGLRGWGIPTATDIAFALGCLALLRGRVPTSLAVFLMALAIFDDLGAIVVIALFYGQALNGPALLLSGVIVLGLVAMNAYGVRRPVPYLLVGVLLWGAVLASGVHATIAGVLLGLCIPARARKRADEQLEELSHHLEEVRRSDKDAGEAALSAIERYLEEIQTPLARLVHGLHVPVAFVIIPAFALANAGVDLENLTLADMASPVSLGVAVGLFLGKQTGIFLATFAAVKLRLSPMPTGASWRQVFGVAVLGGIGFTMSLFIAALAFPGDPKLNVAAKIGILLGSAGSAIVGMVVLRFGGKGNGLQALP
jgi:NhaA family Na+:H+ antiporter